MHKPAPAQAKQVAAAPSGLLAPDTTGMNFYRADQALTDLLRIHLPETPIPSHRTASRSPG
ncbi:hypothetical protein ACVWWK_000841 [Bradyrhizobium sp. LB9.1b]